MTKITHQSVLVLAPHNDDESIGAGGLIRILAKQRYKVSLITVFGGETGCPSLKPQAARKKRRNESNVAAKHLGIATTFFLSLPDRGTVSEQGLTFTLVKYLRKIKPTLVIAPHSAEAEPEHALVARAAREACWQAASPIFPELGMPAPCIELLLGYEIWTTISRPLVYVDISTVIEDKLKAIRAHKSQIAQVAYDEAALGLARYRGTLSFSGKYAEAYEIVQLRAPRALAMIFSRLPVLRFT